MGNVRWILIQPLYYKGIFPSGSRDGRELAVIEPAQSPTGEDGHPQLFADRMGKLVGFVQLAERHTRLEYLSILFATNLGL